MSSVLMDAIIRLTNRFEVNITQDALRHHVVFVIRQYYGRSYWHEYSQRFDMLKCQDEAVATALNRIADAWDEIKVLDRRDK